MPIAHWTCLGSDIVHAELFGTHLVALNSEKVARDLLEKRSSIYSDRFVGQYIVILPDFLFVYQAPIESSDGIVRRPVTNLFLCQQFMQTRRRKMGIQSFPIRQQVEGLA
jgi:hypothetical protein